MSLLFELNQVPRPFVLCMIIQTNQSAPGKTGFKMIVLPDGSTQGTVGGGDIEYLTIQTAREMLLSGQKARTEVFDLGTSASKTKGKTRKTKRTAKQTAKEATQKTAMICGGRTTVYFELFASEPKALLFGGGHIAQSIAPLLIQLGFQVIVHDNRKEILKPGNYPPRVTVKIGDYKTLTAEATLDESTYCFIFTHGHAHDATVLKGLLLKSSKNGSRGPKYLGMIGSRVKVRATLDRLEKEGLPRAQLNTVRTPIGLNIGGETPFEIALSICAEVQTVRYDRPGTPMVVLPSSD